MPDEVVNTTTEQPEVAPVETNPAPAGDVGLSAETPAADPTPAQEQEPPKEVAPEEYQDFVDDKGVAFAAKEMPEFTAMAKELGLTQEKAQKLLMTMVPTVKVKLNSTLTNVKEQWKQAALNDSEYGGDAFKANMQVANKAYSKFVTPELQGLMKRSGLSAHPDFIRMFYRIGSSMSQDTGVTGQGSPQPKRRLFPNSNMAM